MPAHGLAFVRLLPMPDGYPPHHTHSIIHCCRPPIPRHFALTAAPTGP